MPRIDGLNELQKGIGQKPLALDMEDQEEGLDIKFDFLSKHYLVVEQG